MAQVSAEKETLLRERQERLTSLANHPGWAQLKQVFAARKEAHVKSVAAKLIAGEEIQQRELDRIHGWWAGCQWLINNPDMAESSLKKALAAAKLMEEDG